MVRSAFVASLCVVPFTPEALRHGDRRMNPILRTPDTTGYDPIELLCTKGKDANGSPNIQGWCQSWMQCIRTKAQPAMDKAAVSAAWAPADCREYCGVWPVVTAVNATNATAGAAALPQLSKKDCMASCHNFQDSLSTCVATILFEPGKMATMGGAPARPGAKATPEHCLAKDTPCLPDLAVRHQRCLSHNTKVALDASHKIPDDVKRSCDMLKFDMDTCKDCPQLAEGYGGEYHAFVGGCMDQLNAYWQASHPNGGNQAIPGSSGCSVHSA